MPLQRLQPHVWCATHCAAAATSRHGCGAVGGSVGRVGRVGPTFSTKHSAVAIGKSVPVLTCTTVNL